jgi:alkylhydroperoxidase/carboxymuconolactone decarboxylase family protein YurZ
MSDTDPAFERGLKRRREVLGDDLHFRAALEHGVPVETLKEVLLQSAVYCGLPAANTAFHRAEALLSSRSRGTTL